MADRGVVRRYRKLPVVIEAVQFTGTGDSCYEVAAFVGGMSGRSCRWKSNAHEGGYIVTLEGEMEFQPGDYVIRDVAGEFYPCQPDIFEATYEMVEE